MFVTKVTKNGRGWHRLVYVNKRGEYIGSERERASEQVSSIRQRGRDTKKGDKEGGQGGKEVGRKTKAKTNHVIHRNIFFSFFLFPSRGIITASTQTPPPAHTQPAHRQLQEETTNRK